MLAPLGHAQSGFVNVVADMGLASTTAHHRHQALFDPPGDVGQPGLEMLETALFVGPLGPGFIAAGPTLPATHGSVQASLDSADRGSETGPVVQQVLVAAFPLIRRRAGNRPSPPAGGLRGQRLLAYRAVQVLGAFPETASDGQVLPGQHPQVAADLPQHIMILTVNFETGPYPCPRRGPNDKWIGDLTHPHHHPYAR